MLTDIVLAVAILLGGAALADIGLWYNVGFAGSALLLVGIVLSEMLARGRRWPFTGFVLALVVAGACAVLGHFAALTISSADWGPDFARQFFFPLTLAAAAAALGSLAHYLRYRAPFGWIIAIGAGLYAVFGALKLMLGAQWLHL